MRFQRLGDRGQEIPVVLDETGAARDLRSLTPDVDGAFFAADGVARARTALREGTLPVLDAAGLRVGAPVARPGLLACIGLNYSDHAAETGAEPPAEPVVFLKATNTIVGPDDTVLIPRTSTRTDYEVELAVVLGGRARYLATPEDADAVIAGYAVSDDVSERDFQHERGGQWTKGKSCETFNPLGPWLVTPDEAGDPQDLRLRLAVNGQPRQDGTTRNMLFGVRHIVWYLSQFMVLEPGDVVNTGTPAGVAFGANDFPYLSEGDEVTVDIDGLGRQHHRIGRA
ncbi:fumarylacetoacetate hydrolase family protein [Amycolatopsis sp. DG1A-15b]|uniref:fumarylacetoacetate hydrolase family protein n=1 Tax=Amycolatopsis sp. DG1A-15b TaxID=3052846 RepID=UPI00255B762E|nr:fumarylacetoacetate hydrolase family protein [Amycolatopsis sp. DG1A-15b]WIX89838.1 fumarylacetoacetate hydrolase family protein [Amycolatopsis sp. DG1A-15b]